MTKMDEVLNDKRFSHVAKDPRFRKMQKHRRKVKIDKRFKSMFKDDNFKLKYSVDKRGRPVSTSTNENLQKYYEMSSEESEGDTSASNDEQTVSKISDVGKRKSPKLESKHQGTSSSKRDNLEKVKAKEKSMNIDREQKLKTKKTKQESESEEIDEETTSSSSDAHIEADPDTAREELEHSTSEEESDEDESDNKEAGPDFARGEGLVESSSEEDSEEDASEDNEDEFDHGWGEMDKEAPLTENITSRLAVCNMDWDRLKAQDIMVMLNSFKPIGGTVQAVYVYPSEFGKKRLKEEEMKGPTELVETTEKKNKEEYGEGSEYHREKLRQYQLKRFQYYYAVVECDNAETANHIYEQCDGMEYEGSGNRLDLRFIPDGMTFDDEAKSVAKDVPDLSVYKPTMFTSTALQQSAVQCTWDETDQDRIKVTMKKFDTKELEDMDLKDYLASESEDEEIEFDGDKASDSDESDGEDKQINKYRQLLQELGDSKEKREDKDMEMEITWEPGLRDATESLIKKKTEKEELTPWENYLAKKKEKKRKKKQEKHKEKNQPTSSDAEMDADQSDYSDDDLPAGVDLSDPYFKEELDKMEETKKKSNKKTKKKKKHKEKLTPEELEAKEQREAELKLLLMDEDDQYQHFNLKQLMEPTDKKLTKKQRRKLKKQQEDVVNVEDNFQLEVDDPRFKVLFENPLYNIDPSAPEYKKTKAMEKLIEEKIKRTKHKRAKKKRKVEDGTLNYEGKRDVTELEAKKHKHSQNQDVSKKQKTNEGRNVHGGGSIDVDLDSLVKSVKAKTKVLEYKKRKK